MLEEEIANSLMKIFYYQDFLSDLFIFQKKNSEGVGPSFIPNNHAHSLTKPDTSTGRLQSSSDFLNVIFRYFGISKF